MDNCIFCKIVRGDIPASLLYRDTETVSFLDINPTNKGHALVVPAVHARDVYTMSSQSIESTFKVVKQIASAVKAATGAAGVNIVMNNEPAAGQVIFHAHVHVIPRFENDGLTSWPHRYSYEESERELLAKKIEASL